jgi:hypothetical protein
MVIWLLACNPDPEPIELSVDLSIPNPATAPLVRQLHAEASGPVTLTASWTSGDHTVEVAFEDSAAVQDHLLLGWRPGRSYAVTVTATSADGATRSVELDVTTDALPAHFPQAEVIPGTGERAPGHTLIPMDSFLPQVTPSGVVIVFDEEGEICYWLDLGDFVLNAFEWDGGLLALVGEEKSRLVRYDWDGTPLKTWSIADDTADVHIGATWADTLHHDVQPFPDDPTRFAALSRFGLEVPDYPASYDDPALTAPEVVAIDTLLVFDDQGVVSTEVRLDELVPLDRIGFDSLEDTFEGRADWAHSNAIVHDGDDFLVSLRHQDAIVKIDPAANEIEWILGYPENWTADLEAKRLQPVGELRWPYHQHGPRLLPTDGPNGERRLVVFDNGNWQAAPYTGEPPVTDERQLRSRVVQFTIDEQAKTIRQDWQFDSPSGGRLFVEAVGEADPLPNGHVLSAWGLLFTLPDGTPNAEAGLADRSVRIIEIDPETVTEVEQLYVSTPRAANSKGWTGYRSDRIPSLYGRVVD